MKADSQQGYIALVSLIIIGAIVLSIAIAIAYVSTTQKINMIARNQALRSYYLARACAETAVYKLQENNQYAGNEQIAISGQACFIEPIISQGQGKIVAGSADINNHIRQIQFEISQLKPKIIISKIEYLP